MRSKILREYDTGNVLYIMERDMRIFDNYCVELGYEISYKSKNKFFIGTECISRMNERQKLFYYEGITELYKSCLKYNIYFGKILNLKKFVNENNIKVIIVEYSPLREHINYVNKIINIMEKLNVGVIQCDSHNIVPHWMLVKYKKTGKSVKNDLFKYWTEYFKEFKILNKHKYNNIKETVGYDEKYFNEIINIKDSKLDSKDNKNNFKGGYSNGMAEFELFLKNKLLLYHKERNNANIDVQSNLSPWIHFGQVSTQRIILRMYEYLKENNISKGDDNVLTFINEIFVWKETAEHFCSYNKDYDKLSGALDWAKDSLKLHESDKREKIYKEKELEKGETEDIEWNAGQKELVLAGKMHGYVRMYWAKKILYWTKTPEEALKIANKFNDKYSLDGNDPNGYLGTMWSICGSMDQGFKEREIIGKIRPMSGYKAKKYTKKWNNFIIS